MKKSTRAFFAEARRTKNFSFFDFLHGYFYLRFIYQYIGIAAGANPAGKIYSRLTEMFQKLFTAPAKTPEQKAGSIQFADTYHGKVVPIGTARTLVSVNKEINYSYPEQVIPYKLARDIILHDPEHIVALDCPCRVNRENPCLPLDVCLIIGEPFASMAVEHQPEHTRWITQQEAVDILIAEEKRGHVHHAFFKQAMLNRFYAICNCCSCCCAAMEGHRHGNNMLASSGYISRINVEACLGCGTCETMCQFHAINVVDEMAVVDEVACMGCGVCVSSCPNEAVELVPDPQKGIPMEVPAYV